MINLLLENFKNQTFINAELKDPESISPYCSLPKLLRNDKKFDNIQ
jgi:hypothetical protein